MSAIAIAHTFLWATLSQSVALAAAGGWVVGGEAKVYESVAPQGTLPPYVIYAFLGSTDLIMVSYDLPIVHTVARYAVKAVGQSRALGMLAAMMAVVHPLLHGNKHTVVDGGLVVAGSRQGELLLADPDMGVEFRQLGAVYEFIVQET